MLIEFRMMLTSGRKDIGFERKEQEELSGDNKNILHLDLDSGYIYKHIFLSHSALYFKVSTFYHTYIRT